MSKIITLAAPMIITGRRSPLVRVKPIVRPRCAGPYVIIPRSPVFGRTTGPFSVGNFTPNKPVGWNNSSEIDFSQAVPAFSTNDQTIGTTDWNVAGNWPGGPTWAQFTDANALRSPSTCWRGHWTPGDYYEPKTIPSSGPFTITPTYIANYGTDVGVRDNNGNDMTVVGSNPAVGQYSVSAGIYTFNSAQAGQTVYLAYTFGSLSGLTPGSVANGVDGGVSIGSVGTNITIGLTHLYCSVWVYFEYPDAGTIDWHSISNKFINIGSNLDNILVEVYESGNWLHASELASATSMDAGTGQVNNNPVPTNQWNQVEMVIDLSNKLWKVWLAGTLKSDSTQRPGGQYPFSATSLTDFSIKAFRGGGGEYLASDLYWRYDHFYLAW